MKKDIFFSFNICCYNSEKYIRETIDSIINQNYKFWEIVIINDGSTDNTENIIFEYLDKKVPINYFKQENKGFANARNKAIELSKHDWIVIIDHDDLCHQDRLEIHSEQIYNNPDCMLFFGDSIIFSDSNNHITNHFSRFNLNNISLLKGKAYQSLITEGCFIDSETVVFNKNASMKIGNFNIKYNYIVDYDFFLKMGMNYNFNYSKKILSKWRVHENQATNLLADIYKKEYILLLFDNISFNNSTYLNLNILFKILKQFIKSFVDVVRAKF